ncbi:hypothetical protein RCL1_002791 [Eukaryota sp. TZLM3-RCL]
MRRMVGKDYKPPTSNQMSGPMIKELENDIKVDLSTVVKKFEVTGVSLVSDGWSDRHSRPLINLLTVAPNGSLFLTVFDTSGKEKTGQFIAATIQEYLLTQQDERITIKENSVIQIITDSAAGCVSSGSLLETALALY